MGIVPPAPARLAPAQPSPETIQQVERLTAQAAEAHRAFVAEAPGRKALPKPPTGMAPAAKAGPEHAG